MPYLRGNNLRKTATYVKPTLQNQINTLKRRVGKNKAAKSYFRVQYSDSPVSSGVGSSDHSLTNSFIGGSNFRNYVNGDSWTNVGLRLRGVCSMNVITFRVIVYVPKKPGNGLTSSLVKSDLARILDPAAYWVLSDEFIRSDTAGTFQRYINFKGLQTIYNTDSTVLERGDVRIYFAWDTAASGVTHNTSAQLCITDK